MLEDDEEGAHTPLAHTRQMTIDALCEHFANDAMTVEEFERRVDTAHGAATVEELRELLRDLPGGGLPVVAGEGPVPGVASGYAIQRAEDKTEEMRARASAVEELEAAGTFEDLTQLGGGQDEIERELAQLGAASQVDDELAAMKAELGSGSGDAPQLGDGEEAK